MALNAFLQQNINTDQSFYFRHGCPLNKEGFQKEIQFWKPGTVAIAVPLEVGATATPLFVLGAIKTKKYYALTMTKNKPILWELDQEVFSTTKLKQAHLGQVKTDSFATQTTTKPIKEGMKVIPLDPEDLKVLVKENQTEDLSRLAKRKDNRLELASMWLKAPCVAKTDEATKSQVAVTVVQLEEEAVPQDVLEQLQTALLDIRLVQPEAGARLTALLSPLLPAVTAEEKADEEVAETVANPLTKRSQFDLNRNTYVDPVTPPKVTPDRMPPRPRDP